MIQARRPAFVSQNVLKRGEGEERLTDELHLGVNLVGQGLVGDGPLEGDGLKGAPFDEEAEGDELCAGGGLVHPLRLGRAGGVDDGLGCVDDGVAGGRFAVRVGGRVEVPHGVEEGRGEVAEGAVVVGFRGRRGCGDGHDGDEDESRESRRAWPGSGIE
jgi:hypothetical protein